MAAFQPYAGAYSEGPQTLSWSCYATRPVYEVRTFDGRLPEARSGRKWVIRREGAQGPKFALLVDGATTEFSPMLMQIKRPRHAVGALA